MTDISEESVRAEVRAWLEANWNPELGLVEWRNKLIDSGWGVPGWPKEWYGRDLPPGLVPVVEDELPRTDWDKTKHQGLSYFIIDMHQPGVKVQPLKQMNGHASFNQVFMTDAEVQPEFLVANVGDGWAVTPTTLMHERRGADGLRTWAMGSDRK